MKKQKLPIFVKYNLFILLFLFTTLDNKAQSISIFDIDTSSFPTMKAKFYILDQNGKQIKANADDLKISENSIDRKILNVTCPNPKPVKAISSVLVMDVSSSMAGSGSSGIANIELAKQASTSWIYALPTASSQCAITCFDNANYLIQDFTTDRTKLLTAINKLIPYGGTDYDIALNIPIAGGIPIAKMGKYRKIVIILTDGFPNQEPQIQTIINEANKNGIMIFAITLGMPCPDNLKEITTKTGGNWYQNVTTEENAKQIYYSIMNNVNKIEPCEIIWQSNILCSNGNINLELIFDQLKSNSTYKSSQKAISNLRVSPNFIQFGSRNLNSKNDTSIIFTAQNDDFIVTNINLKFGSSDFKIKNYNLPIFIPKNTSKNIEIQFEPTDSSLKYGSFEIESDKCSAQFSVNGGFSGKTIDIKSLKLTHPNGGEKFVIGSDTVITWTGVSASDSVKLEYSYDIGKNWLELSNKATDFQYIWRNIKPPSSANCLAKVSLNRSNKKIDTNALFTLKGHKANIYGVTFSTDGTKVATACWDKTAKIWNCKTGLEIYTLNGHTDNVHKIAFSPDDSKIGTASYDNTAKIWDANTGLELFTLNGHTGRVQSIAFSLDGTKVVTSSADQQIKIWDSNTGSVLNTIPVNNGIVNDISISPDGSQIASASSNGDIQIWDINSGLEINSFPNNLGAVYDISFSPNGKQIVSSSTDNTAKIWDINSGLEIISLNGHSQPVVCSAFSPDGSQIATASLDRTAKIWDINSATVIRTIYGHTNYIHSIAFSPEGNRIATSSADLTAKIWEVEMPILQEDQSDAVFSIVAPEVLSKDIDMKKGLVASSKDSVISNFIENIGSYKCRIDSIYFRGADASAFSLVSGFPQYTVDVAKNHNVELRFKPTKIGIHNAEIVIITQADTLIQKITGEGVQPSLAIINKYIDFGKVYVGDKKDTLKAMTIKNIGSSAINISDVKFLAPNYKDFSMISGSKIFTLGVGDTAKMDLRFSANSVGHQSSFISFEYNNGASSSQVQLYAEGINHGPKIQSEILGITDLKCEGSKLDSIKILNQGDIDLKLDEAKLSGANSDEFELIDNIAGITIPSNKEYFLKYLFIPKSDGNKIAELNIKSNSLDDKDLYLQLEANSIGKYQLFTNAKVFLKGNLGEISTDTIKFLNDYDFDITITDTSKIDPFYFENLKLPFVIKSKESKEIAVKYKAIDKNKIEKIVDFTSEPCKVKSSISLNYGSSSPKAQLFTGTYQAYPGDTISIPIILKDAEDLDESNSKNLTVDLKFNATLLEPIGDTPFGSLSNDKKLRTITLQFSKNVMQDSILGTFKFKVGLGDDSTTKLILLNQSSDAGDVDLQVASGEFHLLGICRAAGPRLINPNGEVKLSLIRPNPVGDNGELDIETIENGLTELYIVNLKGEKVATLYQGELAAGKQTLIISTKYLSNGTYFVILQTPTVTQKVKMEVVK